jgi:AGZA family xanthine/uracil permease-like MFS transporter
MSMREAGQLQLRWWTMDRGDIDATVAQLGFNFAQMLIPIFLLLPVGISMSFGMTNLVPGYALGFLVGSLGLTGLAIGLARKEKRTDVTAHVYGNNVPAIIAYTLTIMLPVYLQTHDAISAWEVGAGAVIITGLIKLAAAPFAAAIERFVPVPALMTVFGAAMYSYLALVLLQRIFDQPLVGLVALMIVASTEFARLPITKWRIPPLLVVWLVPLAIAIGIGYVHPVWQGFAFTLPFVPSWGPVNGVVKALDYLSVIVPISIYLVMQDIAAVEGGKSAGDNYHAGKVLAVDGVGTLICGLAGCVVTPVIYALHPPYKADGARIGFSFWTGIIFFLVVVSGLTASITQLFPWPILSAMIAFVAIGVGTATLRRVDSKYYSAVLLGFVLPTGAIVSSAVSSALPALHLSVADPAVLAALNKSIYWSSLQGLGDGFLFLVLVVSAVIVEMIDRRFGHATIWCLIAAAFSWVGLLHSAVINWGGQWMYAVGWLAVAFIVFTARWWRGDLVKTGGNAPKA